MMRSTAVLSLALLGASLAGQLISPTEQVPASQVTVSLLLSASIVGNSFLVDSFSGIRYAEPPVGGLRLKPPRPIMSPEGLVDATKLAPTCAQLYGIPPVFPDSFTQLIIGAINATFPRTLPENEDCLTLNIMRPVGTKANTKLPVMFWIHGGGFEAGSGSYYNGITLVSTSVALYKPVMYIAINYCLAGFGFLVGKEILADGSANLGLRDQRMALEWVADNIAAFGGDPNRVIIWGESAGSYSVYDQMGLYAGNNTYKGKPLFYGAIMNSGTLFPADPVDTAKAQAIYDTVVEQSNCTDTNDTLDCLRSLDYDTFVRATNSVPSWTSYNSIALSYLPRPDGKVVVDSGEVVAQTGGYAAVPMLVGDQEDEGTIFSMFQTNLSDTSALVDYFSSLYYHGATRSQLLALIETYPESIPAGSPYNTGVVGEVYLGFKRLSAILGDVGFTLLRRVMLDAALQSYPCTPIWSYLSSFEYGTPILGTSHGSDLFPTFYGAQQSHASQSLFYYYTNFAYALNPNGAGDEDNKYLFWPQWNQGRQLLHLFHDNSTLLTDNFRWNSYEWISENIKLLRL